VWGPRDGDKIKSGVLNPRFFLENSLVCANNLTFFSAPMPTVLCTPYLRRFNGLLKFSRQLHTQKHAVHVAECPRNAVQPLRLLLIGSPVCITRMVLLYRHNEKVLVVKLFTSLG
jgi:hypothetical protein